MCFTSGLSASNLLLLGCGYHTFENGPSPHSPQFEHMASGEMVSPISLWTVTTTQPQKEVHHVF